jgi:small subunit ribosomal protein S20
LANTAQARKRVRQAAKRDENNTSKRSTVRTYIKNVVKAIETRDVAKAREAYQAAVPIIDRMAGKGIIHKNKAARHKSRLNERIKELALAAAG